MKHATTSNTVNETDGRESPTPSPIYTALTFQIKWILFLYETEIEPRASIPIGYTMFALLNLSYRRYSIHEEAMYFDNLL